MTHWPAAFSALALCLAAGAAEAQSADGQVAAAVVNPRPTAFTPDLSPDLTDPLFLPAKGQLFGRTSYSTSSPRSQFFNYLGVETRVRTSRRSSTAQALSYGISGRFVVSLSTAYDDNSAQTVTDSKGALTSAETKGLTDPTLSVNYRLARESTTFPVTVDLSGRFNANIIHPSTGEGRQTAGATLGIGRSMRDFSIQITGSILRLGPINASSLHPTGQDSAWSNSLALNTRFRLTRTVSLNGTLGYSSNEDRHSFNTSTKLAATTREPVSRSAGAALNWQILPKRLALAATYTRRSGGETATLYANPASNTANRTGASNSVGLRLLYLIH